MKSYLFKKCVIAGTLFSILLIFNVVTMKALGLAILPIYWQIDVGAFAIISIIGFLLPMAGQLVLSLLSLIVHYLLCLANILLYASAGRVFDWSMMELLDEAGTVGGMVIVPTKPVFILTVLLVSFIALSIIVKHYSKVSYYKKFLHNFLYLMGLSGLVTCVILESIIPTKILSTYDEKRYFTSPSFIYSTFEGSSTSLQMFGFWGYYFNDLARKVFPSFTPELNLKNAYLGEEYTSILKGINEGDNVIFILAESFEDYLITKATTPVLYALKNGIDLSDVGISNFYDVTTDANGQRVLRRKDFDQNLVSNGTDLFLGLQEGEVGLTLNQYISIESTNYSELRLLTGNMETYEFTIPKMLNSQGYVTNYIHGNEGTFYGRNESMTGKVGFTNSLFYENMDESIPFTDDLSFIMQDSDIISYYLSHEDEFEFINDDKFFTFMMTVSTHGGYTINELTQDLMQEFLTKFKTYSSAYPEDEIISLLNSCQDENLKEMVFNFMASAIDTEESVALLIDELYRKNKLDDTILVFVSDHQSYGNGVLKFKEEYFKSVRMGDYNSAQSNVIPAFIYSSNVKSKDLEDAGFSREINHLTTAFDIAPTILTMLGVNYDPVCYFGYPVINAEVNSGKLLYNNVGYSTTNGYFFNEKYIRILGTLQDREMMQGETEDYFDVIYDGINKFWTKKYYLMECINRKLI